NYSPSKKLKPASKQAKAPHPSGLHQFSEFRARDHRTLCARICQPVTLLAKRMECARLAGALNVEAVWGNRKGPPRAPPTLPAQFDVAVTCLCAANRNLRSVGGEFALGRPIWTHARPKVRYPGFDFGCRRLPWPGMGGPRSKVQSQSRESTADGPAGA